MSGKCTKLIASIDDSLSKSRSFHQLNNSRRIGLVGPPNVGKSTLMNSLAQSAVSIVSQYEGTTRDVVSRRVWLEGEEIEALDTAGLRETVDPVERMGVERTV